MNFRELTRFVDSIGSKYNIPCYDICVYYNHVNVFRRKHGFLGGSKKLKAFGRNLYFMHSGAKIMCCTALMRLVQSYKVSLGDSVSDWLPDFDNSVKIRDMMREFSRTYDYEDKRFNFVNMSALIEKVSGMSFEEYVNAEIIKPLRMKSTSFSLNEKNKKHIALQYDFDKSADDFVECDIDPRKLYEKNKGCLITTVDDYARFCEALCAGGTAQNGYRLLSRESVDILINDIIYKETEKDDAFVCVGYNGGLILIDTKKKITIVYAQHIRNMPVNQLEMYPELRRCVYECIGTDTWSMGYNMFP